MPVESDGNFWPRTVRKVFFLMALSSALGSIPGAEEIDLDSGASRASADTGKFEELKFEKSLVIEAKVERPQVQFPLLKEPPPEKPIPFEISFREELLKHPRENTFAPPKAAK